MTTLTVKPNRVLVGQVVTMTSSTCFVAGDTCAGPVNAGTVTFFSDTQPLAIMQVKKSDGTAMLMTRLPPGSHTLTAQYNGTNMFQPSPSMPQMLMVNGTEPTISTLSAVPHGSNYDFTLNVFGFGYPAPTGTASLDELQVPPIHLGDFTLAAPGAVSMQAEQATR